MPDDHRDDALLGSARIATELLEAIAQHAALPAHGIDSVCKYCEARGLCRKGMWDA